MTLLQLIYKIGFSGHWAKQENNYTTIYNMHNYPVATISETVVGDIHLHSIPNSMLLGLLITYAKTPLTQRAEI